MKGLAVFLSVLLGVAFVLFVGLSFKSKKEKVVNYEVYVNEVINQFAKEMKNEYGMQCVGDGGRMPHDVEKIGVDFAICRKVDITEARILEVTAVEKFLKIINSHEKLRPFLREYPFTAERIEVSIAFYNKDNKYYSNGGVDYLFQAKGKVYYYKTDPELHNIAKFSEEPYETALKIVNESKKK